MTSDLAEVEEERKSLKTMKVQCLILITIKNGLNI